MLEEFFGFFFFFTETLRAFFPFLMFSGKQWCIRDLLGASRKSPCRGLSLIFTKKYPFFMSKKYPINH